MKRTTVFAEPQMYQDLRRIAEAQGRPVAAVIRDALGQYVATHRPKGRRFSFTGIGESETGDLSQRVDEIVREHLENEFRQERESWEQELRRRAAEK